MRLSRTANIEDRYDEHFNPVDRPKLIFVASKFCGSEINQSVTTAICRSIMQSGKIPIAPQLYFTRFLNEHDGDERMQGIKAGLELMRLCDEVWVCGLKTDKKISHGMRLEIDAARRLGKEVKQLWI